MMIRTLHTVCLSLIFINIVSAQLSPGDLAEAHAHLEGISNCTQCHVLGEKVSDDKCLACHKEIKSRVDRNLGYHSSNEIKGKDCAECHSDHHGRKFDMIRFDEDQFDHNLAGYELTGAHQAIDCRQCHIPDFVDDPDLKKKKETYLGLSQECKSCHEDYHQSTLPNDCAACHMTDEFVPASLFNHDNTDFKLLGKHEGVECIDCHQKEIRNGKEFQQFAGVEFSNCNSCHEDVHKSNLGSNCKSCHTEDDFSSLSALRRFNHRKTNFPLKGAHQRINCGDCHSMDASPTTVFQDLLGTKTNECNTCHEDVHKEKFGQQCAECHNENSFHQVNMDEFNHGMTDFALLGKHSAVDCRQCHTESYTEPLPHNECAACHVDYHEGDFLSEGTSPDCAQCHTEDGFEESLYTIENHQESTFPLDGAHIATPCFACHLKEEKWRFRDIGQGCADCHEDVHAGFINEKYYPGQSCENCHMSSSWFDNQFDHSLTEFELQGAHAKQKCMDCHLTGDESQQNRYEGFVSLSQECHSCHENVHEQQFEINGITDCARCHGFENWTLDNFNHNKTAFKLEGKHAEIECAACHKEVQVDGNIFIQYKFESFECIDCHL